MPILPHALILDLHAQQTAHQRAQQGYGVAVGCMLLGWFALGMLILSSYIAPDPPGTVLPHPGDAPRRASIAPTVPRREPRRPAPPWP